MLHLSTINSTNINSSSVILDVSGILSSTDEVCVDKRIDYFSKLFLGKKYVDNPLGDGESSLYDKRELYCFDKFDCQTYIETVICLALSKNKHEFEKLTNRVRYKNSKPHILYRNRFIFTNWIKYNQEKKILKDITPEVIGNPDLLSRRDTPYSPKVFFDTLEEELKYCQGDTSQILKKLKQEKGYKVKKTKYRVIYIPLPAFFYPANSHSSGKINKELIGKIPSGAIIVFNKSGHSHMALAIWKGEKLHIRHACNIRNKMAEDVFSTYLMSVKIFKTFEVVMVFTAQTRTQHL